MWQLVSIFPFHYTLSMRLLNKTLVLTLSYFYAVAFLQGCTSCLENFKVSVTHRSVMRHWNSCHTVDDFLLSPPCTQHSNRTLKPCGKSESKPRKKGEYGAPALKKKKQPTLWRFIYSFIWNRKRERRREKVLSITPWSLPQVTTKAGGVPGWSQESGKLLWSLPHRCIESALLLFPSTLAESWTRNRAGRIPMAIQHWMPLLQVVAYPVLPQCQL